MAVMNFDDTVEPPITDSLKSGQPLHSGQTKRHRLIPYHINTKITSASDPLNSEQRTLLDALSTFCNTKLPPVADKKPHPQLLLDSIS